MKNGTIGTGVIEGFFGPQWPWQDRSLFLEQIARVGGDFYIYAPKRDSYLRKEWQKTYPEHEFRRIENLKERCREVGLAFGVGLTPFEAHHQWDTEVKTALSRKLAELNTLGLDILGIFFDDMKAASGMQKIQTEIVKFTSDHTEAKIIFCPSYYSDDEILDKVFGKRPSSYLEDIGRDIPPEVDIFWTGPKVISKEISRSHLERVSETLKRKPVLWDNSFANDGPKNCKFLKFFPFTGKEPGVFEESSGWAFNLMNQPALSEIMYESASNVLIKGVHPDTSFQKALLDHGGKNFAKFVTAHVKDFAKTSLDEIAPAFKNGLQESLVTCHHERVKKEISGWLNGEYQVGPECLTD